LLAGGVEVPQKVYAHGMWLDPNGRRMSKTLGNTIDLEVLHRFFSNDAVRYFCLRDMVFGQDGRFGYENLIDRTNSDLASGLGNLSSRTLTMIQRYCGGVIPEGSISEEKYLSAKRAGVDPDAVSIASMLERARDQFVQQFDEFAFSRALESAWSVIAKIDKFLSDAKPWELAKQDEQRQTLDAVLYRAAESLRWLAVLLYPVMPDAMSAIYSQVGLKGDLSNINPRDLVWGGLPPGTTIEEVKPVFPRIEKGKVMAEIESEKLHKGVHATEADAVQGSAITAETVPEPPVTHATEADAVPEGRAEANANVVSFIEIDDFSKVDMRVGQVLTAERIPKSDKLLRFTIDVGEQQPRQVLAGIAEYYEPEAMIGRKVIVVANLKPRKLRGFESQGMVVAASVGENGRPVVATFTEDVPNGARLK
jgi:methionyl-tRNA synthetase